MTKLSDIIDGFVKTFTLDDIHNPQPKQSVCRECEIVGSAASMTGAAYLYHITKMGKIMPIPGIFFTTMLGIFSVCLLIPPADDELLKVLKRVQEGRKTENEKEDEK